MKSNPNQGSARFFLIALSSLLIGGLANAASIVEVTYKQGGQLIGSMIYSGKGGGADSDPAPYWELLKRPGAAYDVTVQPDEKNGKVANLKGDIQVSITIRNQFSMGTVDTDTLQLIRSNADSNSWYLPESEIKRLQKLIPAQEAHRKAIEAGVTLLKKGGKLPKNTVVSVHATLANTKDDKQELYESWEFSTDQVHRIIDKRRAESRPFDSSKLLNQLREGNMPTIQLRKGKGEVKMFAGTNFDIGGRLIQLRQKDKILLNLSEHCTFADFPEADSLAFTALYETLAEQARTAFAEPKK